MPDIVQPSREEIIKALERRYQIAERSSFASCMEYLKHVVINCVPPRPFREVAEPWQWALASRIIPAVEYAAQVRRNYDGPKRFWITLPKGHDKTSLIARLLAWAFSFAHTHLTGYAAAKDREQAGLLADAMQIEAALNPWVMKYLKFKNWKVHGRNDSKLHILAADAEGTAGIRGDLIVIDELTQWTNQEFFAQLLAGADKRPRAVVVIITNAGTVGSFQWDALQLAKEFMVKNKSWWVYEAPHRLASWMDENSVNQTRKFLPEVMGRMLFDNVWVPANSANAYVTRDQAQSCEDPLLLSEAVEGPCFAAIDYGPVKDRTALSVVRRVGDGVRIERLDVWQGSRQDHVKIARVEEWIDEVRQIYPMEQFIFDKYQMESTIQKYTGSIQIEIFEPRGPAGNTALAENLRHLIVNQKIRWTPGAGLLLVKGKDGRERQETLTDELCSVGVRPVPSGYRIFNPPGSHDDRVVSVGMAALYAMRGRVKRDLMDGEGWF